MTTKTLVQHLKYKALTRKDCQALTNREIAAICYERGFGIWDDMEFWLRGTDLSLEDILEIEEYIKVFVCEGTIA